MKEILSETNILSKRTTIIAALCFTVTVGSAMRNKALNSQVSRDDL